MDIEFTVKLVVKNAIDPDALREEYNNSPFDFIKYITHEEGLLGCVEDNYEILEAHEIKESK